MFQKNIKKFFPIVVLFAILPFVLFLTSDAKASDDVDVLIACPKPYAGLVAQVEAVGGTVRFQYKNIDGVAATIPRDNLSDIQGLPGITAFRRDLTISLEDPPVVTRQGFGEVQSRYTLRASDISGDVVEFTTAAPAGYFPLKPISPALLISGVRPDISAKA